MKRNRTQLKKKEQSAGNTINNPDSVSNDNNISEIITDFSQFLPPPTPSRPFFTSLLCSIFEPGVNSSLLTAIHFVFVSLLLVHLWLVYLTEGKDLHVWALMGINMMLYPSLLIFINLAYNKKE